MEEVITGDIIRIRYKGEITKSDGEFMYDYDVLKKIKQEGEQINNDRR